MIQFAISVTSRGLGFLEAIFMSLKRMPKTVGYIMKNKSIPIGMDKFANFSESMNSPNEGRNLPTSKPTTMHAAIHSVRYFSHLPRESSCLTCSACSFLVSNSYTPVGVIREKYIQVIKYVALINHAAYSQSTNPQQKPSQLDCKKPTFLPFDPLAAQHSPKSQDDEKQ